MAYQPGCNAGTCDNHDIEEKNIPDILGLMRDVSVSLPCAKVLQAFLVLRPCCNRRAGVCSLCWLYQKKYLGAKI